MTFFHGSPNRKKSQSTLWLIPIALLLSILLNSCGPLPKEEDSAWVRLNLQLHSNHSQKTQRSGTESRGAELAIAVPASTRFTAQGPNPSEALDWETVNTTDNTVSLRLPVEEPVSLFVYRYATAYSKFELEQAMLSRTLHWHAIDFGQSEIFSVPSSGTSIVVDGKNSSVLTVRLARQLTGRLAQNYVMGAQVWADRPDALGELNQQLDADETVSTSGLNGEYALAPDYLDYVLITEGGLKLDASGAYIPAAPMQATIPDDSQMAVNITPLTTLVAAAPELAEIFVQSGDWRADIASLEGIPADLMRVAKATEAFWMLLSSGSNPIIQNTRQQFSALSILAQKLAQGGRGAILGDLPSLLGQAVEETINNPEIARELSEDSKTVFIAQLTSLAAKLTELLPDNAQVIEESLLPDFDLLNQQAFAAVETVLCESSESVSIQFDPIILSISLIQTSETTVALRGTVSDDSVESLSIHWMINPPIGLQGTISPVVLNAVVSAEGYVDSILTIENWDHFGSVSLQLTECSPVNVLSESCNWVPNSSQVNCNFME